MLSRTKTRLDGTWMGGVKTRALLAAAAVTSLQLLATAYASPPWGMKLLAPGSFFALFAFAPVGFAGPAGYFGAGAANLAFWYWIFIFLLGKRRQKNQPSSE